MAILRIEEDLYRIAFADPSGGKQAGAGRSRSAICAIGMDIYERVFILRDWAANCPTDFFIEQIFTFNHRYRPVVFGIDSTGPQSAFTDAVRREHRRREVDVGAPIRFPLRPVTLRDEKTFAIETTIQPLAAAGRLFRPPEGEVRDLKAEMLAFPNGIHRDALDALACAIRLLPRRPIDETDKLAREQLRVYLQKTGASDREIARRLAQREQRL